MKLLQGDCFEVMQNLEDNSVDLVLTDPPYGLKFMGKKWDYDVPPTHVWYECLRVLKPGGHLLAFAGTRTQHRMACRIEDAGFEIRDMLAWVYGSGFPKSLDVSKAIDKAAGAVREVVGSWKPTGTARPSIHGSHSAAKTTSDCGYEPDIEARINITAPATDAAREWDGWGTALKPALEPITMARKPLVGTVASNVMQYGTGALNIDACRVGTGADKGVWPITKRRHNDVAWTVQPVETDTTTGRWPANLIHDGSDEVVGMFPMTKSGKAVVGTGRDGNHTRGIYGAKESKIASCYADEGSAARFFYVAKSSKRERGEGNHHPTVKPIALMEYLCKLASSEGQTILDPFMGSGTTGIACQNLNRNFIGIEMNEEYFEIARNRINNAVVETLF